jgi:hypothetical protein
MVPGRRENAHGTIQRRIILERHQQSKQRQKIENENEHHGGPNHDLEFCLRVPVIP